MIIKHVNFKPPTSSYGVRRYAPAHQKETNSQETVTTERLASVTATAQTFTQELLRSHTQNFIERISNLNNATHVPVEPEPSPGNSGSHRQRVNNNQVQIGHAQTALHGEALSRSNSQQQQQQQLSLPAGHQHETYNTPVQAQIATAARREAEPGSSQKSKTTAVPKNKKMKKKKRKAADTEAKDEAGELKGLRAQLAEMESRESSRKREKKRKIKREVFVKVEDAHPGSGTSAPGPSSAYALDECQHDRITEEDLRSMTDMSNSELEEMMSLSSQKPKLKNKRLSHKQACSHSSSSDSDGGEAQTGTSSDST